MEIWKPVSEFPDRYEVSNLGRIRVKSTGLVRKHTLLNTNYLSVKIKIGKKTYNRLVHRLVAREFCKGYADGLVVNHKNADRLDNRACNLEWLTQKENIADMKRRGTHNVKSAHKVAHERRKIPTQQYTIDGVFVAEFPSARSAASMVGLDENNISSVARHQNGRKTSGGYMWRYACLLNKESEAK